MSNQPAGNERREIRLDGRRGAGRFARVEKAANPRRALARLLPYLQPFLLPIIRFFLP
jgi:hypothetical protein